ncbi:MAG: hypothetical protein IPG87_00790 [Saprospiraceae bacterium]|nr:hypothetical protein [Candidatus Vicinibacter affinis]
MPFVQTPLIENNFNIRFNDSAIASQYYCKTIFIPNYNLNNSLNLSDILDNETYVQLLNKAEEDLELNSKYYNLDNDKKILNKIFTNILPSIFSLNPDRISAELTYNRSIIFTILVQNILYYVESFFEFQEMDDESIYSKFDKNIGVKSYMGSINQVIDHLTSEINFNSLHTRELGVNV